MMDLITAIDIYTAVFEELESRKGFNWWWDDLDEDIQDDIVEAVVAAIRGRE